PADPPARARLHAQAVHGAGRGAADLFLRRAAPEDGGREDFISESAQDRGEETPGHRRELQARSALSDPAAENKRIMQRLAKDLSAALRELDVSTLHLLILEHILGMPPEQQEGGANIHYTQDEEAALLRLEKEDFQAA